MRRCLNCPSVIIRARGNCGTCYQQLYDQVKSGQTTWAQLVREGKATAAGNHKRLGFLFYKNK
jgi:hypothetical protein